MKEREIVILYILVLFLFLLPIYLTPFVHDSGFAKLSYGFYGSTCHQIIYRSYCYFPEKMSIEDCTKNTSIPSINKSIISIKDGYVGYKFPVCARDMPLYTFALISGILFFFLRKGKEREIPKLRWFILAILPLAIDGVGQLFGFWMSNNAIRFITGAIAGFAFSFYAIPLLVNIFVKRKKKQKKK